MSTAQLILTLTNLAITAFAFTTWHTARKTRHQTEQRCAELKRTLEATTAKWNTVHVQTHSISPEVRRLFLNEVHRSTTFHAPRTGAPTRPRRHH